MLLDPSPGALEAALDTAVALDVLARLCAARTVVDVAEAALGPLCGLPGVRAGLLAVAPRRGADPVVVGTSGYSCAAMAPGAVLPRDAGLPVTEAVRTGRTVVRGDRRHGPGWVAVAVPEAAALLLSLDGPPPADVAVLEQLARPLGDALARASGEEVIRTDLLVLEQGLAPPLPVAPDLVVLSRPYSGSLSGDVVERCPAQGGSWLLVADVSGRGASAAVAADRLRAAFLAVAPECAAPSQVLTALDRALAGSLAGTEESFATALVLRLTRTHLRLASAGHPAPLLLAPGRAVHPVALVPGPPLGLRLEAVAPAAADAAVPLGPHDRVLAWTDGLTDRHEEVDLLDALARLRPVLGSSPAPQELARALTAACDAVGAAQDDATLVVLSRD